MKYENKIEKKDKKKMPYFVRKTKTLKKNKRRKKKRNNIPSFNVNLEEIKDLKRKEK